MPTKNIQDVVAATLAKLKSYNLLSSPHPNQDDEEVAGEILTQLVKEERERIGKELMRLAEGEKPKYDVADKHGKETNCSFHCHSAGEYTAIDTMKKHITNVTGVE